MSDRTAVCRGDVVEGLREVGLKPGDIVVVHSSLSSMGYVVGGADTVVDAFFDVIGPQGTLVMPAFSFDWDKVRDVMVRLPFERGASPSNMGRITETFRRRKGTLRSNHSTHSWCAVGPKAKRLLFGDRDPSEVSSLKWELLFQWGGCILLLGVHHNRSTIMHCVEGICRDDVPYLKVMYTEGSKHPTRADHGIFNGIEEYLIKHAAIRFGKIGEATIRFMDAKHLVETSSKILLEEDPSALLCSDPECQFCCWGRRKNRQVLSQEEAAP